MTHKDGFPRLRPGARGAAMRGIGSHAPPLKAMGRLKALGSRLRSRRRTGSGRIGAGVGKP